MRDVPPFSLGGSDDYAISPASDEVAYVMNADRDLATSTNSDIYVVPIGGGESKKISTSPGADSGPVYSPDGAYIAFRSQARAGYESDRWRLALYDRSAGKVSFLNDSLDRNVNSVFWTPDAKRVFFVSEDRGRHSLQMIPVQGGGSKTIIGGAVSVDDLQFSSDGKTLIYTQQSGSKPTEIYRVSSSGGAAVPLTKLNNSLLAQYEVRDLEDFWVESKDGSRVQSFVVKPPGFKEDHKYPVLFLIHGGPQGAWGESFGIAGTRRCLPRRGTW